MKPLVSISVKIMNVRSKICFYTVQQFLAIMKRVTNDFNSLGFICFILKNNSF